MNYGISKYSSAHLKHFTISWVNYPDLLVLTGGEEEWTIPVETARVDDVWVNINCAQSFPTANIPDDHNVVWASWQENIVGGWMPHYHSHTTLVIHQIHHRLCHRPGPRENYSCIETRRRGNIRGFVKVGWNTSWSTVGEWWQWSIIWSCLIIHMALKLQQQWYVYI